MSRKPFTFRPQLEVLETRLAPGSLGGWSRPGGDAEDDAVAEHRREMDELARMMAIRTTSPVVSAADPSIVLPGSSTLTRTERGISVHLETSGLTPGHAYTIWWGIDSTPESPRIGGRITGFVVKNHNGKIDVEGHLKVGQIVGDPPVPGQEGILTAQDALHARILVAVRDHGPALTGQALFEQTHTFQADTAVNVRVSIHDFR
jgi:hypothetical protein